MPQQPQPIEELLQRSARPAQSLDSAKKDALWTRIQEQAQAEEATTLFNVSVASTSWWLKPLSMQWSIGIGFATMLVAIAGVYATMDQTNRAQELALQAAQQPILYTNGGIVSEVAELPEEKQEEQNEEKDEDQKQIASTDTKSTTLFRSTVRDLIGGFGGALVLNTNLWKVSAVASLSDKSVGNLYELYIYRLEESRMRELAEVFTFEGELRLHNSTQPSHRLPFMTNLDEGIATGGGCFDNALRNTMGTQRCVTVSQLGAVEFIQEEAVAQADGMAEAYAYIETLTGSKAREFKVDDLGIANEFAEEADLFEGAHEYMIYPPAELAGYDYQTPGWHIALKNGKLIFLTGSVPHIQANPEAKSYSIISSAEAVERLQADWAHPTNVDTDAGPHYIVRQTFGGGLLGMAATYDENGEYLASIADEEVDVVIESTRLEYRVFTSETWGNGKEAKRTQARVIPLWVLYGVERSTNTPFEALVDATADNSVATYTEGFSPINHPFALQ